MLSDDDSVNKDAKIDFNSVLTSFILFELEHSIQTIPFEDIHLVENLIIFHENMENYEICDKLLKYKNLCLDSNTI